MNIQLFRNGRGLIHGTDNKRISCDVGGTLAIGTVKVSIAPGTEEVMPLLYNGGAGEYYATFTSALGNVYELGKVALRAGRILPPPQVIVELMELRCRVETLEDENKALKEEVRELRNIFDTDSLNFLIK